MAGNLDLDLVTRTWINLKLKECKPVAFGMYLGKSSVRISIVAANGSLLNMAFLRLWKCEGNGDKENHAVENPVQALFLADSHRLVAEEAL